MKMDLVGSPGRSNAPPSLHCGGVMSQSPASGENQSQVSGIYVGIVV